MCNSKRVQEQPGAVNPVSQRQGSTTNNQGAPHVEFPGRGTVIRRRILRSVSNRGPLLQMETREKEERGRSSSSFAQTRGTSPQRSRKQHPEQRYFQASRKMPIQTGTRGNTGRMGSNGQTTRGRSTGRVEGGYQPPTALPGRDKPRIPTAARSSATRNPESTGSSQHVGGQRHSERRATSRPPTGARPKGTPGSASTTRARGGMELPQDCSCCPGSDTCWTAAATTTPSPHDIWMQQMRDRKAQRDREDAWIRTQQSWHQARPILKRGSQAEGTGFTVAGGAKWAHTFTTIPASELHQICLLYTSPSPRDLSTSRMPSSA